MNLDEAINRLSKGNQPFVCYRLPQASEPVLLSGGSFIKPDSENFDLDGFLFVPFSATYEYPELIYTGATKAIGWKNHAAVHSHQPLVDDPVASKYEYPCINSEEYLQQAYGLLQKLRDGTLQKVVLSAVQSTPLPKQFSPGDFFRALCLRYPEAFVYVVQLSPNNYWMGASPELLLEIQNGEGKTMSLAGTLPASTQVQSTDGWTNKELDENAFVWEYILETLKKVGITQLQEMPMESVLAGPVVHLRKMLSFEVPQHIPAQLISEALHPTPAVCGIPANEAMQSILETEKHPRNYYSGYLGPTLGSANVHLYVNLRCMNIRNDIAYIFAGGGLMPQSDLQKEWEEIQAKANTLLSVLKENYHDV